MSLALQPATSSASPEGESPGQTSTWAERQPSTVVIDRPVSIDESLGRLLLLRTFDAQRAPDHWIGAGMAANGLLTLEARVAQGADRAQPAGAPLVWRASRGWTLGGPDLPAGDAVWVGSLGSGEGLGLIHAWDGSDSLGSRIRHLDVFRLDLTAPVLAEIDSMRPDGSIAKAPSTQLRLASMSMRKKAQGNVRAVDAVFRDGIGVIAVGYSGNPAFYELDLSSGVWQVLTVEGTRLEGCRDLGDSLIHADPFPNDPAGPPLGGALAPGQQQLPGTDLVMVKEGAVVANGAMHRSVIAHCRTPAVPDPNDPEMPQVDTFTVALCPLDSTALLDPPCAVLFNPGRRATVAAPAPASDRSWLGQPETDMLVLVQAWTTKSESGPETLFASIQSAKLDALPADLGTDAPGMMQPEPSTDGRTWPYPVLTPELAMGQGGLASIDAWASGGPQVLVRLTFLDGTVRWLRGQAAEASWWESCTVTRSSVPPLELNAPVLLAIPPLPGQ